MFKKVLFLTALAFVTLASQAQSEGKIGVWYGVNISDVNSDFDTDSEFKALNIGVDYTGAISEAFDWTGGLAYVTKGCKDWDPAFIQIDANATWNFVKSDDFKIGVLTGPYADFMVNKDDMEDTKTFSWGWSAGLKAYYKAFTLKAGYELGLSDVVKGGKSKANGIFVRVGYSF